MKFNIYYGSGNEFKNQQLINSFDTIKKAEKFLLGYIKERHPNSGYVRINFISDSQDNMTMDTIQSFTQL